MDVMRSKKGRPVGGEYRHPIEVAYHSRLSARDKLMILTRWASDSSAIPGAPLMRRDPDTGVAAHIDEVAAALQALDEEVARRARASELRTLTRLRRDARAAAGSDLPAGAEGVKPGRAAA